jgi:hypothetical protein
MNDENLLKLTSIAAGLVIVETCLVLGVDGAGMLIGGTLLGVPIGAGIQKHRSRKAT